ncbi:hypothetical protein MRB53_026979 [Persea americana]|uniref:Uncharacterized protein n=1 Tax=Persea americana TaxID=3435 RepID=A0ACC2LKF0_PERAE|nr:hypothetical protein MRB53_026979 [Persea americana]
MVLNLLGPESLKERLLLQVEEAACKNLRLWSSQPSVELKEATAEMIFDLTANNLISYDPTKSTENLRENFVAFIQGLISFPINIPVPNSVLTMFVQGRKKAMKMLKNMLQERLASPEKQYRDFFDYVVEELKKEKPILTEPIALDLMFVLLFASFETTSLAITLAIKFLTDHPSVLVKLTVSNSTFPEIVFYPVFIQWSITPSLYQEEHETIRRSRDAIHSGITWKENKSMTFTSLVINETVRLANIVPGIFRKALQDVQINEYMIPKGWVVMVCPPAVHLNPEIYQDLLALNPSRWDGRITEQGLESNGRSKHFMAFGWGMRFCVGTDFTKLQMAILLHCLVSKYRWTAIRGGNIVRTPGLSFPNGYHIQLFEKLP